MTMFRLILALTLLVIAGGIYAIKYQAKPELPDAGLLPPHPAPIHLGDLTYKPIASMLLNRVAGQLGGPTPQQVQSIQAHIESLRQHAIASGAPTDAKTYTDSLNQVLACTDKTLSTPPANAGSNCLQDMLNQIASTAIASPH